MIGNFVQHSRFVDFHILCCLQHELHSIIDSDLFKLVPRSVGSSSIAAKWIGLLTYPFRSFIFLAKSPFFLAVKKSCLFRLQICTVADAVYVSTHYLLAEHFWQRLSALERRQEYQFLSTNRPRQSFISCLPEVLMLVSWRHSWQSKFAIRFDRSIGSPAQFECYPIE